MSERIFIPARRADDILIYEYFEMPTQRRWQFRVVLAQDGPEGELKRTGSGTVSADELERCKGLVAALPDVEKALSGVNLANAASFGGVLAADPAAAIVTKSMLFTSTLYLNLMRQSLVEESSISRYESRAPDERFDIGLSASIYDGLIKRHDLERAEALLNADLPHAIAPKRQHREWAYFFKIAAEIKLRQNAKRSAVALLEQAVKSLPEAATLRRIASLLVDLEDREAAIEAFEKSHSIEPLGPQPRLRLAWCYFQIGNTEMAGKLAKKSLEMGNENATKLLEKLSEQEES